MAFYITSYSAQIKVEECIRYTQHAVSIPFDDVFFFSVVEKKKRILR